jgi:hypothetical protein
MTQIEVLNEIKKMTLSEKRVLLEKLSMELSVEVIERTDGDELSFAESLLEKGLLSGIPPRNPDDEIREKFTRISVNGKPISATIIEERG